MLIFGVGSIASSNTKVAEDIFYNRTPDPINELKKEGYTESEIAKFTLEIPIEYQDNWTEEDNARIVDKLEQMRGPYDVQKDGRMIIHEERYRGINGYSHPGKLEVSDNGIHCHYFTSHLGADGKWIEVGVARFYDNPDECIVFTYDSTSDEPWKTWGRTDPELDHQFLIYIYDEKDETGEYPYDIWWDNADGDGLQLIRSGDVPFLNGNPDECHEFFAEKVDNFESCSIGYFKDSFLYRGDSAYWWNDDLDETTEAYGLSPVKVDMHEESRAYRIDSWID